MIPIFLISQSNNTTPGVQPPGGGTSGKDLFPGIGLPNSPPPRWLGVMANLPGTGVVLFGGKTTANNLYNGLLNDTWVWNGTVWSQSNVTGPSARNDCVMSYDGYNLTMFGGADGTSNLSDTWSFTGSAWNLINNGLGPSYIPNVSNPSRLKAAKLSYQSGSGKAYMFGGKDFIAHYVKDTWSWASPSTWAVLSPFATPSGRAYHAQASNATATVVFGGINFENMLSDTWFFDGTFWNIVTPVGGVTPSIRYGASMVFDSANNVFILFGGITPVGYNAETWKFNLSTSTWTQVVTPFNATPLRRAFAQMAYDVTNGNTVLFGGLKDDTDLNDTWLFNSTSGTWTPQ
jgi:hypothetical protein